MELKKYNIFKNKEKQHKDIIRYINMKLASMGQPIYAGETSDPQEGMTEQEFVDLAENLLNNYKEKMRLLSSEIINPADKRIQNFINRYFNGLDFDKPLRMPFDSFVLDKAGIGREVSLPPNANKFENRLIKSYRIAQGILHNPLHDRRTTKDSFHIADGGLPVPPDKKEVPRIAFAHMLHAALNPPENYMILPFTSAQENKAYVWTSLMLRPTVSPEVPGIMPRRTMEIRFFAPGSLVSNLDFVESIFGNAGDPYLYKNDSGLDIEHWTGHTGCVILAPQLLELKKSEIGLPSWEDATDRQRQEGICWKDKNELYNEGVSFKISCRDEHGVIITLLADNYFGYSKKEVKTQISYSANMLGLCEEEHAGGTLAFSRRNIGNWFSAAGLIQNLEGHFSFEEVKNQYAHMMDLFPENYGVDKTYPNVIYVPENVEFSLNDSLVSWEYKGIRNGIKLLRDHYYVLPSGQKVHMEKHPFAPNWYLVLTFAEGTFLHKPNTVSGGGKSEISKSLLNAIIYGTFYIDDKDHDFAKVDEIFAYDYSLRWKDLTDKEQTNRPILDPGRTLGSTIKLLTFYEGYTDEYNAFVKSISDHVKALVLLIKKISLTQPLGDNWRDLFSIDTVNGRLGHSLMYDNRKIYASYLRVGFARDNSWFVHSLRPDFIAAAKVQMEDDISASITIPASQLNNLHPDQNKLSVKLVENCEQLFFQRPDEAIHRGYDKQAEEDLSKKNIFTTNFEPLTPEDGKEIIDDAIHFDKYTDPIKALILKGAADKDGNYFISPSHARKLDDNTRSGNPRYLQTNPVFSNPVDAYLAKVGTRLIRKIPLDNPVHFPVTNILAGRKNNPADSASGLRSLSVYNPIHYQEYPELFMDFICSLTGKSPSTTGAGSEGALTKGPFNMLVATTDLNNALLSYILTGYDGFSTSAGYVGPRNRFDHDISILIPELWCRMDREEKNPKRLIREGLLERVDDFEYQGGKVLASRLGYRITQDFIFKYLGRIFEEPMGVFSREVLRPELQDMEEFVDGINNIVEAQQKSAMMYIEDGSVDAAIPPLQVLLYVMAHGHYKNMEISDAELRKMFTREYVLSSEWYQERLLLKQQQDIRHWQAQMDYISAFKAVKVNESLLAELHIAGKLSYAERELNKVKSDAYLQSLTGTIGLDPIFKGNK
jgi:phosphoenolpyruvate carboxykinase (diphosphate)